MRVDDEEEEKKGADEQSWKDGVGGQISRQVSSRSWCQIIKERIIVVNTLYSLNFCDLLKSKTSAPKKTAYFKAALYLSTGLKNWPVERKNKMLRYSDLLILNPSAYTLIPTHNTKISINILSLYLASEVIRF